MILPGGSTKEFAYDPLMRVKSITAKDPGQNVLLNYQYTFDKVDNITQKVTEHGDYDYDYDDLYRLADVDNPDFDDEAFTYDGVGNRLTAEGVNGDWSYNTNNEITGYDDVSYIYDANGNMTQKIVGGVVTKFFYNTEDRLSEVRDGNDALIASYYYDPFGRRLWKEVGGTRTYFHYADEGLIGEYDSTGNEIKTYGYKPGSTWTTNPLFMKEGSSYYFYHNDHLGTPQKMTAVNGAVVWSAKYSSFGEATVDAASTVTNPLRFPGQYFDAETGLHYNWHRYYDPEIGRYLRADPIGFEGGINIYEYVFNNPLNFYDPWGLKLCKINLPGLGTVYVDDSIAHDVKKFMELNKKSGIDVTFSSAFRSSKKQKSLKNNPNATTPAAGGTSLHEAGFAVDINWSRIPKSKRNTVVQNAKKAGLSWGGDFTKKDPVHFYKEVPGGSKNRSKYIKQAQKEYGGGKVCGCPK